MNKNMGIIPEKHMSCLVRISSVKKWPPSQNLIPKYILDNPRLAYTRGIEELAKEIGTSTASITRFCKRLEYEGFADFKRALLVDIISSPEDIHTEITLKDSMSTLIQKVFNTATQTLKNTLAITESRTLNKAVDFIIRARKVDIYGVGGSGIVAQDTNHKFITIGINSTSLIDSHLQAMSASLLDKNCVAIGISHSGSTPETLRALRLAKEVGAKTICVTNQRHSKIVEYSDFSLFTASHESTVVGIPVASRVAQITLLDSLFVGVAMKKYEDSLENVYKTGYATR
jgi:DNA-binding MurR/RpiR family transcriptional regulator